MTAAGLKEQLRARNSEFPLGETNKHKDNSSVIGEPKEVVQGTSDALQGEGISKDADSIASQTGGVGEEWGEGDAETKTHMVVGGDATGVFEQMQQRGGRAGQNGVGEDSVVGEQLTDSQGSVDGAMGSPDLADAGGVTTVKS